MEHIDWDSPDFGIDEQLVVERNIRTNFKDLKCSNSPMVAAFEDAVKDKLGVTHAIAVNNGTSALIAALLAAGFKHNTALKIGIPTFTFIATHNAAITAGKLTGTTSGIGLFDCDPRTWNMKIDNHDLQRYNVLMPVDVGGLPIDYDAFKATGKVIIADSAESLGAKYKGKYVGSQADAHCFSLHRAKNIACGEGGLVTTNDDELAELVRSVVNHGYSTNRNPWEYKHDRFGLNFRMTGIHALVALKQLEKLDEYIIRRQKHAKLYIDLLQDIMLFQGVPEYAEHPYFFFGALIDKNPDVFCRMMLLDHGITCKRWECILTQPAAHYFTHHKHSSYIGDHLVLLPIHNQMTEEQVVYVADRARKVYYEC